MNKTTRWAAGVTFFLTPVFFGMIAFESRTEYLGTWIELIGTAIVLSAVTFLVMVAAGFLRGKGSLGWLKQVCSVPGGWSPMAILACAALALPGTILPQEAGLSAHNSYWTLGWPLPFKVTLYGPSSGASGMSVPPPLGILCSFALWFGIAAFSFWIWRKTQTGKAMLARALAAGVVCALWGLMLTWFALEAGNFLLGWHWRSLDAPELQRSTMRLVRIYPALCVGLLSVPLILQFLISRRYRLWPRVAFCSALLLLWAGLSTPYAVSIQSAYSGWPLPILQPVVSSQCYYGHFLELMDVMDRDTPKRRPVGSAANQTSPTAESP